MGEQELRKREARLTARETALLRRERDLASREAELADAGATDGVMAALRSLTEGTRVPIRERVAVLMQIAAGLWLMVAPLALGYARNDPRGATVSCGAALALLGLWRVAATGPAADTAAWLTAGVATILLAVATLADKTLVAGTTDAAGGLAAWIPLLCGWSPHRAGPAHEVADWSEH
jgi:hypothetical protein